MCILRRTETGHGRAFEGTGDGVRPKVYDIPEQVQSAGVIEITAHNRTIGGFLSAAELQHYHDMKKREREVIRVRDMDDETMALIQNSEYGKASE